MGCERFGGKVALITGGGTGIGAAAAHRIAAEGGKVVVMGRREGPLQDVARAIGGLAVVGDTSKIEDLERAVAESCERFGGLDLLVANAGIEQFGTVESIPLEDWRKMCDINLDGMMLASRIAIPAMRRRGGGSIVLVSSVAALVGAPAFVAYLTTKTALAGLNRSIAYDYGPENIRCNMLCPGAVSTDLLMDAIGEMAAAKGTDVQTLAAACVKPYPLRRMGRPDEIAAVIAFLGSEDASFITGATIVADGGGGIVDVGTLAFT
jgi:NAD(P)-dependent dehydrogenase (short-subunit alcohol dehydrogenase family)